MFVDDTTKKIRVPIEYGANCLNDDGSLTVYVQLSKRRRTHADAPHIYKKEKEHQPTSANPQINEQRQPSSNDRRQAALYKELFDEDEPETCTTTATSDTQKAGTDAPPASFAQQTCITFHDPSNVLMTGRNMAFRLPPTVAMRVWAFPTSKTAVDLADSGSSPHPTIDGRRSDDASVHLWCWHDCHPFSGKVFRLPLTKQQVVGVYNVIGYFCSLACARAYNFGAMTDGDAAKNKRDGLLMEIAIKYYGFKYVHAVGDDTTSGVAKTPKKLVCAPCPIAPSRLLLKEFGGPLSIEEFRVYTQPSCTLRVDLEEPFIIIPQTAVERSTEQMPYNGECKLTTAARQAFDCSPLSTRTSFDTPTSGDAFGSTISNGSHASSHKRTSVETTPRLNEPSELVAAKREEFKTHQLFSRQKQPIYGHTWKRRTNNSGGNGVSTAHAPYPSPVKDTIHGQHGSTQQQTNTARNEHASHATKQHTTTQDRCPSSSGIQMLDVISKQRRRRKTRDDNAAAIADPSQKPRPQKRRRRQGITPADTATAAPPTGNAPPRKRQCRVGITEMMQPPPSSATTGATSVPIQGGVHLFDDIVTYADIDTTTATAKRAPAIATKTPQNIATNTIRRSFRPLSSIIGDHTKQQHTT